MSRFATYHQLSRSSQILNLFFRKVPSLHPDVLFACASPFFRLPDLGLNILIIIILHPRCFVWRQAGGLRWKVSFQPWILDFPSTFHIPPYTKSHLSPSTFHLPPFTSRQAHRAAGISPPRTCPRAISLPAPRGISWCPSIFLRKIIGPPGFEPGTSCTRNKRTTKLCYGPNEGS